MVNYNNNRFNVLNYTVHFTNFVSFLEVTSKYLVVTHNCDVFGLFVGPEIILYTFPFKESLFLFLCI